MHRRPHAEFALNLAPGRRRYSSHQVATGEARDSCRAFVTPAARKRSGTVDYADQKCSRRGICHARTVRSCVGRYPRPQDGSNHRRSTVSTDAFARQTGRFGDEKTCQLSAQQNHNRILTES